MGSLESAWATRCFSEAAVLVRCKVWFVAGDGFSVYRHCRGHRQISALDSVKSNADSIHSREARVRAAGGNREETGDEHGFCDTRSQQAGDQEDMRSTESRRSSDEPVT